MSACNWIRLYEVYGLYACIRHIHTRRVQRSLAPLSFPSRKTQGIYPRLGVLVSEVPGTGVQTVQLTEFAYANRLG
jgi:hypothetical protein